ncbi:hypothetical protein MUS1_10870 [Marinomonas ushuaiensis DSM 15871]|uniref:DUF1127 domain-containing protein n=1 Tax=Marinomonas ushuaiensis DSM 15871 TaxID=1122207 RepID=X7E5U2_9GAMM|nr:hypothetical protein [Marinomonas ushuaiensis]ETX11399.1 hypothetical protein MUS1_10870 [Marinomonas ushuaiensis DSM 15871]
MLVISLFVHIQHCVQRYQSRKALALLSAQQMCDIGITDDEKQTEIAHASVLGFVRDLLRQVKKGMKAL